MNPQRFSLQCDTGPRSKSGRKKERELPSPESISFKTLEHCLLGDFQAISEEDEGKCWEELDHILNSCGRRKSSCASRPSLASRSPEELLRAQATARKMFVAVLAEWVNMHDLHRPHAMGPPSKDMACATIENEHSTTQLSLIHI